ncbi:MAG: hypothetical protein WD904_06465 [Dehalococcoidia bacterium]
MPTLRIEHSAPDYDAWKASFDSDPLDRKGSGVRSYRVMRAADDPNYVMVDLEFESHAEAEALLAELHKLWDRVQAAGLIGSPAGRILDAVETVDL